MPLRALLEHSGLLRPKLRVLDAGAGFGTATFALLDALRAKNMDAQAIDAFDLTCVINFGCSTRGEWQRITKILIEWWWHATCYSRKELRAAFATAGFALAFIRFPFRYFWQSASNHVFVTKRNSSSRPPSSADELNSEFV